jgi:transposase
VGTDRAAATAGRQWRQAMARSPPGDQRDPVEAANRCSVARPAERYGPWKTAHERLRIWTVDGTWQRILDEVIVKDDSVGNVEWTFSIDSSSVRAHQHAAGARKKGGCTTEWVEDLAVDREALGRSRGGLTSKIHLAVDARGLPMSVILSPGQAGDNPQLLPLLDQIAVGRDRPGRPRTHPDRVLADKAYSHPSTRAAMRARGIAFTSPERSDQIARRKAKGSRGGRPPAFDPERYTGRNVAERCSIHSNSSARSPPATPNASPTTAQKSSSPPSCYGCVPTYRTRPSQKLVSWPRTRRSAGSGGPTRG